MRKHSAPSAFKSRPVGFEIGQIRYTNALKLTFLPEHVEQHSGGRARIAVSKEIHDIVEIAWTCAFGKGSDLFSKGFFVRIRVHCDGIFRSVAIGMENRRGDRWQDNTFIGREVQFDTRHTLAAWRHRPLVPDLSLTRPSASWVVVD